MSAISKLILSVVLLGSFSAYAADEICNGGDVIACPGFELPTYKSLDLYEGKSVYGLQSSVIQSNDYRVIVSSLIDRIAQYDITRANLYRSYLRNFESEVRFVEDSDFGDIHDEGFIAIPRGCELQQAAAQFRNKTPEGIKYIFNKAIWLNMNAETRAGLVMHEFIYREALLPINGFKTSSLVRYFNAFVHSSKFENGTIQDYKNAVSFTGLKQ